MINPQPGEAPVYARLAKSLRDQILSGQLQGGQALPSERDMEQVYGLGRHTIRKAIGVLRVEGLVVIVKGRGTFVREPGEMQDLFPAPGSTVTARMPTAEERATLELDEGTPVFWVVAPDGSGEIFPADRWRLRWP